MTTASTGGSRDRDQQERTEPTTAPRGRIPADTFATRLLLARTLAGHLSIREAAEATGLNRGSWQGWERGLRPRDILDVVRRIAEVLDIDEHWLLFGGPLLPARGKPVNRPTQMSESTGADTTGYRGVIVRTSEHQPISRPRTNAAARAVRRARLIDRTELLAA